MNSKKKIKEIFYSTNTCIEKATNDYFQKHNLYANNIHTLGFKNFFKGRVNLYINYTNFKLIAQFFKIQRFKNNKILDLGAGFGDKTIILKRLFPESEIYGVETTVNDDPHQKKNPPHLIFKNIYPFFQRKFGVSLSLYDGYNLNFPDNYFDIIILYAVIEHIAPEHRRKFMKKISKKLKQGGCIVITRCPRKYSLTEFISRILKRGPHPWVLSKKDLTGIFDEKDYELMQLRSISNIPSNPFHLVNRIAPILILIDKVLQYIYWPFSSDYFLIEMKNNK